MNQTAGLVWSVARQYDRAMEELLKVIDMDASYAAAHGTLGLVYARKGMCEQAIEEFEKVASLAGGHPGVVTSLKALTAYSYAVCNRPDKARALVDEICAEPTASLRKKLRPVLREFDIVVIDIPPAMRQCLGCGRHDRNSSRLQQLCLAWSDAASPGHCRHS
jgi:tetratricopeptide (TPR) repeat protein